MSKSIEEQIFNWTYTDEQRAKEAFAANHPDQHNPYGALPQMRLLTYQMPDELLVIGSTPNKSVNWERVCVVGYHNRFL